MGRQSATLKDQDSRFVAPAKSKGRGCFIYIHIHIYTVEKEEEEARVNPTECNMKRSR